MSGFEIAGLVLGAFPILCGAAKGMQGVFKDVDHWWTFEREFGDFVGDLEREHIMFGQILDILLEPLDSISQDERQALRHDPESTLWFEPRIQRALKHRVQDRFFDSFMKQLQDMNDALNELHAILQLDQAYYLQSNSFRSVIKRLRMSFSHKKDRILSNIQSQNVNLNGFLEREQARHLSRILIRAPKSSDGAIASLLEFQEQAKFAFEGFQQHWTCTCTAGSHPCLISARESHVRLLLENGTAMAHIEVHVEKTKELLGPRTITACQISRKHEDVAAFRQQVSVEKILKKSEHEERDPKRIWKKAVSALSPRSHSAIADTHGNPTSPDKTKASRVTKRPKGPGGLEIRTLRVHFDSDPPPCTPVVDDPTTETLPGHEAIKDMCLAIEKQGSFLGFLETPEAKVLLHRDSATQPSQIGTLEDFLEATPWRDARLRLGLSIISSILKLGPSWVPENWHRSSLVFLQTPEPLPHPYVSHPSIQATLKGKTRNAEVTSSTQESLLTLGILLLELLFHDTLERQKFRKDYLGSQGKPNDKTDFCTAIRWQKQVAKEFGRPIADVIRRCVYCDFGPVPDLGNCEFVRAVWLMVVKPLEEFLKAFSDKV